MNKSDTKLRQLIYELMNGCLERFPAEESRYVEDEFAEGKYCEKKYQEVYDANVRLCERLGTSKEDRDVETIINRLMEIQEYLCMKMFDYGWMFATQGTDH